MSFNKGENEFVLVKIEYQDDLPNFELEKFYNCPSDYKKIEYMIKNTVGIKFTDWQHENELRIITNSHSIKRGLMPLSKFIPFLQCTGIIMGYKSKNSAINYAKKLLNKYKKYNMNLKKSVLDENLFSIKIINGV